MIRGLLFIVLLFPTMLIAENLPAYVRIVPDDGTPVFVPRLTFARTTNAFQVTLGAGGSTDFDIDPALTDTLYLAAGDINFHLATFANGGGFAACAGTKTVTFTLSYFQGAVETIIGTSTETFTVLATGTNTFDFPSMFNLAAITELDPGDIIRLNISPVTGALCVLGEFPTGGTDDDATHVDLETSPILTVTKTSEVQNDPVNGISNPKAIPNAQIRYTIEVQNSGSSPTETDTLSITDQIPDDVRLQFAAGGGNPITLNDPDGNLSFTYTSLTSTTDDVEFYNNNGTTLIVTPTVDAQNVDSTVPPIDQIRVNFDGFLDNSLTAPFPIFSIEFDTELQ